MAARITVGARQWLILGALAQSRKASLPLEVIYQHMAPWMYPNEVRTALAHLYASGLVVTFKESGRVVITPRGMNARREVRKTNVPTHWPLVLPVGVSDK